MANVTIRNLPDETYEVLKKRAEANRRSLNQELIRSLEEVAQGKPGARGYTLEEIRRMRIKPKKPITAKLIDEAKRYGRE